MIPTISRRMAASGSSSIWVISVPLRKIRPLVRFSRPAITMSRLVLPAPLGPRILTVSPTLIRKSIPFKMFTEAAVFPSVKCAAFRSMTVGSSADGDRGADMREISSLFERRTTEMDYLMGGFHAALEKPVVMP